MKIKTKKMSYEEVLKLPRAEHFLPKRPNILLSSIVRLAAIPDLLQTHFSYEKVRMEEAGKGPWLILMNHSSFIDLEIVSRIFYPKPYGIICTSDGFVGKKGLMRGLGCIPTKKFVSDTTLIGDMKYALDELKISILMYPEASYSFDGKATPLPRKLGILLKRLNVPVISVHTYGAFSRDPLYNCLQKRKVKVSAKVSCLLTREEIKEKTVDELDEILDREFCFDNFKWQQENKVEISESFRADGLERILYRCPHCGTEGEMLGKGISVCCNHCKKSYTLDTYGNLSGGEDGIFNHIPDWYEWERNEVKKELELGTYRMDIPVEIGVMVDYKAIYMVGDGRLVHDEKGFHLIGCDGKLDYEQSPLASYSLYSDYYWYEIGDMICIGNKDILYYCFPKNKEPVAKARIAAEELYKMKRKSRRRELKTEQ